MLRLVACVGAAVLWVALSYAATYGLYQLGNEKEDCRIFEERVVGVEGEFPSLKHTCVYRRADGSVFKESDYAPQFGVLAIGLLVGLVPAATFLWLGLGWPELRRRRAGHDAAT